MKTHMLFAAIALTLPLATQATPEDEMYTFALGDVTAHLKGSPCDNEKVQTVLQDTAGFRAADVEWQGQNYAACWAVIDRQVVVVDETGDAGFLDPRGFQDGKSPVARVMYRT
jgi:hypothetical protein